MSLEAISTCKVVTIMAVFAAAAVEAGAAVASTAPATIMGDGALRVWCIVGSVLGAILSVCFWPPHGVDTTSFVRNLSLKFTASGVSGVVLTPLAIRYGGVSIDIDMVMCLSAVVASLSVWLAHQVIPYAEQVIAKRGQRLVTDQDRDS